MILNKTHYLNQGRGKATNISRKKVLSFYQRNQALKVSSTNKHLQKNVNFLLF